MGPKRGTFIFGGILLLFAFRNYTTSRKTIQRDLLRKSSQDHWAPKQVPSTSLGTKNETDRVLKTNALSRETDKILKESSTGAVIQNKVNTAALGVVRSEHKDVETVPSVRPSNDVPSDAGVAVVNATKPSEVQGLVTESDKQLNKNASVSSPEKPKVEHQNVTELSRNETSHSVAADAGSVSISSNETHLVKSIDNNATNTTSDSSKPLNDQHPKVEMAPINGTDINRERISDEPEAESGERIANATLPPVVRVNATEIGRNNNEIGRNNNTDLGRNATEDTTDVIGNTTSDGTISGASMVDIGAGNPPQTLDVQSLVVKKKEKSQPKTFDEKANLFSVSSNETADNNLKTPPSKHAATETQQKQKQKHKNQNKVEVGAGYSPQTLDIQSSVVKKKELSQPKTFDEKTDLLSISSNETAEKNLKPPPSNNAAKEPQQKQKYKNKNKVEVGAGNSPQTLDVQSSAVKKKEVSQPKTVDEKADLSSVSSNETADNNLKPPPSKHTAKEPQQKQKHKNKTKGPTPIPNVLIAGVQKGGTTSIAHYLNETQNACFSDPIAVISKGEGKESHFFDNFKTYNSSGLEYYQRVFEHCKGKQLIVDGTPEFMKTGQRIFDTYKNHGSLDKLKIIISLREPVSREISWYNHRLRDCPEQAYARSVCKPETNESIPFIEIVQQELAWKLASNETRNVYGTYVQYLRVFFELFDRKNILILSYDEATSNPKAFLQRIHTFLDLPGKPKQLPHDNADKGKHETPPCVVQRALARRFEPYNQELYKLLEQHPGPKMEQRPFPKFTNKCFDEVFPVDEPDPFQKTLPKPRKHIIPNVLIAGAHQTLTTAVSNYCSDIMNGCRPDPLESIDDESSTATHFFDNSNKFKKGLAYYQSLFEHCPSNETVVFDSSADMILYPRRVRELYELQGTAETVKMIFILRDPVYREIEAFQNQAQNCKVDATVDVCSKDGNPVAFESFIEQKVIAKLQNKKFNYMISVYATYLKDWFEVWDRKQILILRYEELEKKPKRFLGRIHDFLGIQTPARPENLRLMGPKTEASCEIREKMSTQFREHNEALYALLEANPGPDMEQNPFPEFDTHKCTS